MDELAELDKKIKEAEASLVFYQGKYNETLAKLLNCKEGESVRVHELISKAYEKGKDAPRIVT